MRKQVYKKYDYDPLKSKYELAKDNKTFLVIHGDGYADTPPEKEWVSGFDGYNVKGEMANDYIVRNFKMQRVVYFKEIELAEEWDLGEDFINELWEAKEGEWHTYHDPSGTVFFKCYQATTEEEYTKDLEMPETWRNVSYGNDELPRIKDNPKTPEQMQETKECI